MITTNDAGHRHVLSAASLFQFLPEPTAAPRSPAAITASVRQWRRRRRQRQQELPGLVTSCVIDLEVAAPRHCTTPVSPLQVGDAVSVDNNGRLTGRISEGRSGDWDAGDARTGNGKHG